jgi:hypothetical protein
MCLPGPPAAAAGLLPAMRRHALRALWLFGRMRPWCAVICAKCKDIVGYEDPGGGYAPTKG